jgi:two-component system cell cycle response regulator
VIRVLVADDDDVSRKVVAAVLARAGYEVLSAGDGAEALAAVRALRPDAVVLDVDMPELDGYEVTRRMRRDPDTSAIPVLLLTAHSRGVDVADGFAAGADDYLRKPFRWEELETRVHALIERRKLIDGLTELARTDALTGLCNRRGWDDELRRELARASRHGHPLALALLDLDRFKGFNDAHGHPAGDSLLRELGQTWPALIREVDLIARLGGEEFALLLPNCGPERALTVVERLRVAVPMAQTCSAGIVEWDGRETADCLVKRADEALYRAKQSGRDRIQSSGSPAARGGRAADSGA